MFLMSMERSATSRSVEEVSMRCAKRIKLLVEVGGLTSLDLYIVAGDQLDLLGSLVGRHVGWLGSCGCVLVRLVCWWLRCCRVVVSKLCWVYSVVDEKKVEVLKVEGASCLERVLPKEGRQGSKWKCYQRTITLCGESIGLDNRQTVVVSSGDW